MSENASPSTLLQSPDGADAVAAAFDRMGRRMAGLAAAVDGFAARQQEIHGRDYDPDLERIHQTQKMFHDAIMKLDARPAMRMTTSGIATDIEKAGQTVREADHLAFEQAQRQLATATQTLQTIVAGRIDLRKQRRILAIIGTAIFVIGMMAGDVVPTMVDRLAPESWDWPEERAAAELNMSGADAGQRLLQIFDPTDWHRLTEADRLFRDNAAALSQCRARAANRGTPVACSIVIGGPTA
jgi:hypothetical protein